MAQSRILFTSFASFLLFGIALHAAEKKPLKLPLAASGKMDFARDIRPVLKKNCFKCHGDEKQKGGLRLDHKDSALRGGDNGPVILAGKAKESALIHRIATTDEDERMPSKGDRLTSEHIGKLIAWIDQGAVWPDDGKATRVKTDHWSFQKVVRPQMPKVKDTAWIAKPIDAFILARLEKEKIEPSPEADRYTLLRRLHLDLTGQPPTVKEIEQFINDKKEGAWQRLVDRTLDSLHFGERWGKHWLDLARYADSDGYEKDLPRPNAWRWRDWVVAAINRDLPFDQFTVQQLAGDMLPGATDQVRIATGFHRNTLTNREGGVDAEEFRVKAVKDRVSTTFSVWMGLTVGCAECHSHKYDPISQRNYYGLFDFFNNSDEQDIKQADTNPQKLAAYEKAKAEHEKKTGQFQEEYDKKKLSLLPKLAEWEKQQNREVKWSTLTAAVMKSESTAEMKQQEDGSIIVSGKAADGDTYTLTAETDLKNITAVRIEALADESLPGKGAGRSSNGGFVLTHFTASVNPKAEKADSGLLSFKSAAADFSDKGSSAGRALVGNAEGWSVTKRKGKGTTAWFETSDKPVNGGWLGNKLIDGSQDGATNLLNVFYRSPMPSAGTVDKVKVYTKAKPGTKFGAYLLRPIGNKRHEVVYKHEYTSDGRTNGVKEYKLPSLWTVHAGDVFAHSGNGGPTFKGNAKNPDTIYYPYGALPKQGDKLALAGARKIASRDYSMQVNFIPASKVEEFVKPSWGEGGAKLTFTLTQKSPEKQHTLRRFRISITDETDPLGNQIGLPKNVLAVLKTKADERNEKQKALLLDHFDSTVPAVQKLKKQIDSYKKKAPKQPKMVNHVMKMSGARKSHIHIRGNFLKKGAEVKSHTPEFLHKLKLRGKAPDRLDFARWIVDTENPLTARVAVNHVWKHLFGHGLVKTAEDFGTQGEKPSYPELLDWLATEFPRLNWSRKALIKLMVMSNTYRQSSATRSDLWEKDPQNQLLARQNRFRLEAEIVRDTYLASSGLLNKRIGGPSFRPNLPDSVKAVQFVNKWKADKGETIYSRSLYIHLQRNLMLPMLMTFDHPDGIVTCSRRMRSNTPLQALTLLNAPVFVESSRALGLRLAHSAAKKPEDWIRSAFLAAVSRPPSDKELALMKKLFSDLLDLYRKDQEAAKQLVGPNPPSNVPLEEAATLVACARTVLNMDEVVTRE